MNAVNELKRHAELGAWRGHDVSFNTENSTFESESAGITGAKTLAEVKAAIDKQAKRKYRAVPVVFLNHWGGEPDPATAVAPAPGQSFNGQPRFWVKRDGTRRIEASDTLILDTPAARAELAQAKQLRDQALALKSEADAIIKRLPRLRELIELEPGDPIE